MTVVVLITDGEPGFFIDGVVQPGCPNNNVPAVAEVARAAYEGPHQIRTYVIGVGPSLDSFNQIAAAGGTVQATMIQVGDPQVTRDTFRVALILIREENISCSIRIPAPPEGEVLDLGRVNVEFRHPTSGYAFVYSEDCAGDTGWRYDDLDNPTRILLCDNTCGQVRADNLGQIVIELGCATRGHPQ